MNPALTLFARSGLTLGGVAVMLLVAFVAVTVLSIATTFLAVRVGAGG